MYSAKKVEEQCWPRWTSNKLIEIFGRSHSARDEVAGESICRQSASFWPTVSPNHLHRICRSDALQWLIQKQGVESIFHYLDNFITVGKPGSPECEINMKIMEQMCKDTGTPVEEDKCEGPTTTIRFLGIELDTVAMEMRLPEDKLQQLRKQVHDWRGKKAVSKRELLSLIGSLQHACKAVRPGRSFMQRLIDLSKQATRLDHHLHLNLSTRSDIEWWHRFAAEWNGTSMFMQVKRDVPDVVVTSDASGSWGCGAFSGSQW